MAINSSSRVDPTSEHDSEFASLREAYDAARDELFRLIDNPEKHLPVAQYRANLNAARAAHDAAHAAMMEAFSAPALDVPNETLDAFAKVFAEAALGKDPWDDPAPQQRPGAPIPKDAVDAAAMAIYGVSRTVSDLQMPQTKERYLEDARNALQAAAPHMLIPVHHHDIEHHAGSFNEGYEVAVTQGLADDPTLADDWFQGKLREARAEALAQAAHAWDEVSDQTPRTGSRAGSWLRARAVSERGGQ